MLRCLYGVAFESFKLHIVTGNKLLMDADKFIQLVLMLNGAQLLKILSETQTETA
jgi:hypothetical protein